MGVKLRAIFHHLVSELILLTFDVLGVPLQENVAPLFASRTRRNPADLTVN
jgi:hypothetical protein